MSDQVYTKSQGIDFRKIFDTLKLAFPVLHSLLSCLVIAAWILVQFNDRIYNYVETGPQVLDFVRNTTYFAASINLLLWLYRKQFTNLILATVLTILSLVVLKASSEYVLLNYILICVAVSNLKIRTCIIFASSFLAILIASAFFANLTEIGNETCIGFRESSYRYPFGQGHPNGLGASLFYLSVCFWTLFKSKLSHLASIAINAILILFLVKYVDSRTSEICLALFTIFIALSFVYDCIHTRLGINLKKTLSAFLLLSFPLFAFFVLYISYSYDPESLVFKTINELFSSRLSLTHNAIGQHGFSLFGSSNVVTYTGDPTGGDGISSQDYACLDSIYAFIAIHWGFIGLFVFAYSYFVIVSKSLVNGNYRIALALFLFSIEGISEIHYISISFNIFIFLLFAEFVSREHKVLFSLKKFLDILKTSYLSLLNFCKICFVTVYIAAKSVYSFSKQNFIVCENVAECSDNLKKSFRHSLVIYCISLLVIFCFFFTDLVDYFKTLFNILGLSDFYSKNLYILFFAIAIAFIVFYAYSIFSVIFYVIFIKRFELHCSKSLWLAVVVGSAVIVGSVIFSKNLIHKEIKNRSQDINLASNLVKVLNDNGQKFSVYVDKVPSLYRRQDLEVEPKIVFFDSVYLDKKSNVVFADPNDEHIILFKNGYKFAKLSPTLSLYVRDDKLLNILEKDEITFSDRYTCKKSFNLKRIAFINHLRYKNNELYLRDQNHFLGCIDPLFFTPGKYRFTLDYHYDAENTWSKDGKLFKFVITSNDGTYTIVEKNVMVDENTNGDRTLTVEFDLRESRYSVNMQVFSNINTHLYFSNISYEKYQ